MIRTHKKLSCLLAMVILSFSAVPSGWAQSSDPSMSEAGSPLAGFLEQSEGFSHKSLMEAIGKFSGEGSGTLYAFSQTKDKKMFGQCTLQHTAVDAQISGYVARVSVTQKFHNSHKKKVEVVYNFPLPESGAVDDMTMRVGDRVVKGEIKRREEAQQIYQNAAAQGYTAALLDQQRPNIFTQSVANIEPDKDVEVTIHYTQLLPYENGEYAFIFPTVVGPRFNPAGPSSDPVEAIQSTVNSIVETVKGPATRPGHDLSMKVSFDSGTPINQVHSLLHPISFSQPDPFHASVSLKDENTLPNKDFVLTWKPGGKGVQTGCLTHKHGKSGYFTLMLMPPDKVRPQDAAPREMIFAVDCSGSMGGAPIEKSKETMHYVLDKMNPTDTFQIIAFSDRVNTLFTKPRPVTDEYRRQAHNFIDKLNGEGGTFMADAIEEACRIPADDNRLRIVSFMTDGYVGNDFEVVSLVKRLRGKSRWFPFGIGISVNHFLINQMAAEGGGEAEDVYLDTPGKVMAEHFYNRISSPVLTDVKLSFTGVNVTDVYPGTVSDVWSNRPLYFNGRYTTAGRGKAVLTGFMQGKPYKQTVDIELPERNSANQSIAQVWAHNKIDDLMSQDWLGMQNGKVDPELKESIVKTALAHHIMTQYTSFVAVDLSHKTRGDAEKEEAALEEVDGTEGQGTFSLQQLKLPEINLPQIDLEAIAVPRPGFAAINWFVAGGKDANFFGGAAPPSLAESLQNSFSNINSQLNKLNTEATNSSGGYATASSPQQFSVPGGSCTGTQTAWTNQAHGCSSAPVLYGATYGTIGPMGGDATVMSGIYTSGSVRVNNLANLEATLNLVAAILDLLTYAVTIFLVWRGIAKMRRQERGGRDIVLGIAWLGLSFLIPFLPLIVVPAGSVILLLKLFGIVMCKLLGIKEPTPQVAPAAESEPASSLVG